MTTELYLSLNPFQIETGLLFSRSAYLIHFAFHLFSALIFLTHSIHTVVISAFNQSTSSASIEIFLFYKLFFLHYTSTAVVFTGENIDQTTTTINIIMSALDFEILFYIIAVLQSARDAYFPITI